MTSNLPPVDSKAAVRLVTEMMAIPGKSTEESKISAFIQKKLKAAGVPAKSITIDKAHKKSHAGGEIGNLIVKLPGTNKKAPRRLLMGHIDTVPLCVGCKPVRKGQFIKSSDPTTALGGDNRAGAAVVLNAALTILKHKLPHPPLTLFWPVQEEIGLCGARYVTKTALGNPKLCFNWDGGSPSVATIGATGAYNIQITVTGIASHAGAHPDRGVSATMIAALALADLQNNGWHGAIKKGTKTGTSNIGIIEGGAATNVVNPEVTVVAEARSHNAKFRAKIVKEFEKAFTKAAKQLKNHEGKRGSIKLESFLRYDSFAMKPSEPTVKAACVAIKDAGLDPVTKISNGGLDANWLSAHGFKTVTLGCGQQHIHTVKEQLHVNDFLTGCKIGLQLATGGE
ncbi:M20/M25/M40 family metallo-hydrolase [bacterium]|nr:M20/M25/M40 family metallo-hydrolase [bacterium]